MEKRRNVRKRKTILDFEIKIGLETDFNKK